MSFRQDRTNPSSAVSLWRGRSDTKKGWPSTAVSTWLNKGLFGGGLAYRIMGFSKGTDVTHQMTPVAAGTDANGNHYVLMAANSHQNMGCVSFDADFVPRGSIRFVSLNSGYWSFGGGYVDRDTEAVWAFGRQTDSNSRWSAVKFPFSDFTGSTTWTINTNSLTEPNAWSGGSSSNTRFVQGGRVKTMGSTVAVVLSGSWAPYSSYMPGMMLLDWTEIDNAADDYSWEKSVRSVSSNVVNSEAGIPLIDSYNQVWTGYRNAWGAAIQQKTLALSDAQDNANFYTNGNDNSQVSTNTSGQGVRQILEDPINVSGDGKSTYYFIVHAQMSGQFSLLVSKTAWSGNTAPTGMTNNVVDMRTGTESVAEFVRSQPGIVDSLGNLYLMVYVYSGSPGITSPMHVMKFDGSDMSIEWHNTFFFTQTADSASTGSRFYNQGWQIGLNPDETKVICYYGWSPTTADANYQSGIIEFPIDGSGTTTLSGSDGIEISKGPDYSPTIAWYLHYCPQTDIGSGSRFDTITTSAAPAWNAYGANMASVTDGGSYNQAVAWSATTVNDAVTGFTAQEVAWP